jgi:hypothetical protein
MIQEELKMELEELAVRFSEGWHEGIKIDASDIMLLNMAAQALAQPEQEQEPVAHCKVRPLRGDESFPKVEIDWVNQPVPGLLYTHPPQRKPLTFSKLCDIEYEITHKYGDFSILRFARAIEAAHGIKETK